VSVGVDSYHPEAKQIQKETEGKETVLEINAFYLFSLHGERRNNGGGVGASD
jgi:hypothetical protein